MKSEQEQPMSEKPVFVEEKDPAWKHASGLVNKFYMKMNLERERNWALEDEVPALTGYEDALSSGWRRRYLARLQIDNDKLLEAQHKSQVRIVKAIVALLDAEEKKWGEVCKTLLQKEQPKKKKDSRSRKPTLEND